MGSLAQMNGGNRVRRAIEQRLEQADSRDDVEDVLWDVVGQLERNAAGAQSLNKAARVLAADAGEIKFPEE